MKAWLWSALALVVCAAPAGATDFRKCTYKVMVSGKNLPATEVPGARFTAWGRGLSTALTSGRPSASRNLNRIADQCVAAAFSASDPKALPEPCRFNPAVHDKKAGGDPSAGISSFTLT